MLNFSDGITVNTGGRLRLLHLDDGWYVVGNGMLIPCANFGDAKSELTKIQNALDPVCECGDPHCSLGTHRGVEAE